MNNMHKLFEKPLDKDYAFTATDKRTHWKQHESELERMLGIAHLDKVRVYAVNRELNHFSVLLDRDCANNLKFIYEIELNMSAGLSVRLKQSFTLNNGNIISHQRYSFKPLFRIDLFKRFEKVLEEKVELFDYDVDESIVKDANDDMISTWIKNINDVIINTDEDQCEELPFITIGDDMWQPEYIQVKGQTITITTSQGEVFKMTRDALYQRTIDGEGFYLPADKVTINDNPIEGEENVLFWKF